VESDTVSAKTKEPLNGCRGVFVALTYDQIASLVGIRTDWEMLEQVREVMEACFPHRSLGCDKSWDAMHRCLSDGTLNPTGGSYPLNRCVLGGVQLYEESGCIITFVPPNEVKDVAAALPSVGKLEMRKRFFALKGYEGPQNEDDCEYTWAYFEEVRDFYAKAAQEKLGMIFFVDQ
jgi:hypothetical protein